MRKNVVFLLLIVFLGGLLRFWGLTNVPPSLYWDEVSQGYNAYSILKTGKDEHQESFPITRFQAFGDNKAPVNIYLTVISLGMFGKNDFSVRFPSAFLGTMTIVMTFFLVKFLFYYEKEKDLLALVSSLFLAISPWHIQLSRAAYEGNIATFFTVAALALFFVSLVKNKWYFLGSVICFVLAFYSFNAHRVFIPIIVLFIGLLYWKNILKKKKVFFISITTGILLLLPFLFYLQTPESRLRFNEVNIFSDIGVIEQSNKLLANDTVSILKVFDNRRVLFLESYFKHYFDFYNPVYLFIKGDVNPRFSDQFNGELYLWILPLLLIGFYGLYLRKSRVALFIVGWFLIAPLAAATARETPHALRSETFIPVFEIISGVGVLSFFSSIKTHRSVYRTSVLFGCFIIVFSLYAFFHNYFSHNSKLNSYDWQYGYRQAIEYVESVKKDYNKIYFTNTYGRPSIYVAWYSNISPQEYWRGIRTVKDSVGFYNTPQLNNYFFVNEFPQNIDNKTIIVTEQSKKLKDVSILKTVNFLNGDPAFVIAKGK
ncbi:MAG: glycosyltransferase family 39 protein [Candidatus Levybacteria bacterium]|nr:glycosyltransferase family 39 protein [Candidatus Levybacteria bacterium]